MRALIFLAYGDQARLLQTKNLAVFLLTPIISNQNIQVKWVECSKTEALTWGRF